MLTLLLDAMSGSHDPVVSNQRSPTSVPPLSIPLILKRNLHRGQIRTHTQKVSATVGGSFRRQTSNYCCFQQPLSVSAKKQMPAARRSDLKSQKTDVRERYLPGPAVRLGIFAVDHAGSLGLDGRGAAPEGCGKGNRWTKHSFFQMLNCTCTIGILPCVVVYSCDLSEIYCIYIFF